MKFEELQRGAVIYDLEYEELSIILDYFTKSKRTELNLLIIEAKQSYQGYSVDAISLKRDFKLVCSAS